MITETRHELTRNRRIYGDMMFGATESNGVVAILEDSLYVSMGRPIRITVTIQIDDSRQDD